MNNEHTRRVRTIANAAKYFKDIDSETAITPTAIRRAVRDKSVSSTRAGNKYLVCIEALAEHFGIAGSNSKADKY